MLHEELFLVLLVCNLHGLSIWKVAARSCSISGQGKKEESIYFAANLWSSRMSLTCHLLTVHPCRLNSSLLHTPSSYANPIPSHCWPSVNLHHDFNSSFCGWESGKQTVSTLSILCYHRVTSYVCADLCDVKCDEHQEIFTHSFSLPSNLPAETDAWLLQI